ncbi:MAG: ABC transporter permease [Tissierellia bacterium]|nr:ABC transporter permease [Tissierellia bacterium]
MRNKLRIPEKVYMFLVFAFLYAPIIVLMVFSFNESRTRGNWTGFSFKWYIELLSDRQVLEALYNTLTIAVVATIVSTIVGTLAAVGFMEYSKNKRKILLSINEIPVLNPDIVIGIGLMVLFTALNIEFGMLTLIIAHIVFTTPYVVLSVLPKLKMMDRNLSEAAMDLGATPMQTLFKVIIPEIKQGIIAGAMMAFTLSIDDFVISFFTKGKGLNTISTTVFSMARRGINPTINALSTIMFAVTLILLVIVYLKTDNKENKLNEKEN